MVLDPYGLPTCRFKMLTGTIKGTLARNKCRNVVIPDVKILTNYVPGPEPEEPPIIEELEHIEIHTPRSTETAISNNSSLKVRAIDTIKVETLTEGDILLVLKKIEHK